MAKGKKKDGNNKEDSRKKGLESLAGLLNGNLEKTICNTEQGDNKLSNNQMSKESRTLPDNRETGGDEKEIGVETDNFQDEYKFLNPYNFVRFLDHNYNNMRSEIGKRTPVTHEKYLISDNSYTGKLLCTAKVETPLFISDGHGVTTDDNKHKTYRFFEVNGKQIVPGSALRGMVRNVFEAATNSCMVVLDDKRLSYRAEADSFKHLIPGRIIEEAGKLYFEILNGTTELKDGGLLPKDKQYAAWVEMYRNSDKKPIRFFRNGVYTERPAKYHILRTPTGWDKGKLIYATLEFVRGLNYWLVINWSLDREEANIYYTNKIEHHKKPEDIKFAEGYLHKTGNNIEKKRYERFFFRDSSITNTPEKLLVSHKVTSDYKVLIESSKRYLIGKKSDGLEISEYLRGKNSENLKNNDLCYAIIKKEKDSIWVVDAVAPVCIPRENHKSTIAELLPAYYQKCYSIENLCPACRVFGWVRDGGIDEKKVESAYRGNVRFSHGEITKIQEPTAMDNNGEHLSILSSPKPTTTRFYLISSAMKPLEGVDEAGCRYEKGKNVLRGRKIYRHHGQSIWNNADKKKNRERKEWLIYKDEQSRTIKNALGAGSEFQFSIYFQNLSKEELGALLWSLHMEKGMFHRLGYAKPLGYGSLQITQVNTEFINLSKRYDTFTLNSWIAGNEVAQECISAFKMSMQEYFGENKFETIDSIKDLQSLLSVSSLENIHYPRLSAEVDAEGKNFEWFVKNKSGSKGAQPFNAMDFPGEGEGISLEPRKRKAP